MFIAWYCIVLEYKVASQSFHLCLNACSVCVQSSALCLDIPFYIPSRSLQPSLSYSYRVLWRLTHRHQRLWLHSRSTASHSSTVCLSNCVSCYPAVLSPSQTSNRWRTEGIADKWTLWFESGHRASAVRRVCVCLQRWRRGKLDTAVDF